MLTKHIHTFQRSSSAHEVSRFWLSLCVRVCICLDTLSPHSSYHVYAPLHPTPTHTDTFETKTSYRQKNEKRCILIVQETSHKADTHLDARHSRRAPPKDSRASRRRCHRLPVPNTKRMSAVELASVHSRGGGRHRHRHACVRGDSVPGGRRPLG